MNDKESEAIDFIKYLVNDYKKQIKIIKDTKNNYGYSKEEIDIIKFRNEQFEIALNLIEKQSKAIDEMAHSLYIADAFSEYGNSKEELKQYFLER